MSLAKVARFRKTMLDGFRIERRLAFDVTAEVSGTFSVDAENPQQACGVHVTQIMSLLSRLGCE